MIRWLERWLARAFVFLAAASLAAYAVDTVIYFARGSPTGTVTVNRYMGVPLKGQKEEYEFLGSQPVPCARALFPHNGEDPCWHLRRNTDQWQNL